MSTPPKTGATNNTKNGFGSHARPNFGPNINVNVGAKQAPQSPAGGLGASNNPGVGVNRTSALALPEPAFYSASDVRTYCEALRAFGSYSAIEVEVAAEILKAALEQTSVSGDHAFQAKLRARKVARKLSKASDALTEAASLAAAAWVTFQHEYADALQPSVRPAQRRTFDFS